ncbi:MAG TPA: KTSC domain-containing protein [Acidobacteriaceae bacterium]|nr:KTSC domain-containing protein [Acidobacteriaceae bacterium]
MELTPVTSAVISAAAYCGSQRLLRVQFRDGKMYQYFDVPAALYRDFCGAPSKGSFFNQTIRQRFRCQRLEKSKAAAAMASARWV